MFLSVVRLVMLLMLLWLWSGVYVGMLFTFLFVVVVIVMDVIVRRIVLNMMGMIFLLCMMYLNWNLLMMDSL